MFTENNFSREQVKFQGSITRKQPMTFWFSVREITHANFKLNLWKTVRFDDEAQNGIKAE